MAPMADGIFQVDFDVNRFQVLVLDADSEFDYPFFNRFRAELFVCPPIVPAFVRSPDGESSLPIGDFPYIAAGVFASSEHAYLSMRALLDPSTTSVRTVCEGQLMRMYHVCYLPVAASGLGEFCAQRAGWHLPQIFKCADSVVKVYVTEHFVEQYGRHGFEGLLFQRVYY